MLGGVALGSLAWTEHETAGDRITGPLHLLADVVHLLAAGAWIGALVALSLLLWQATRNDAIVTVAHAGLVSFGRTGTIVVAAIVASGLVNSWVLVGPGRIGVLPATPWGQLLLVKLALFTAMLGLAGVNRWVLTPTLGRSQATISPATIRRLRWSVVIEAATGTIILVLVAWLGTPGPPALG